MNIMQNWQVYALGSAFFAGLTAILAKIGVANVNSNFATLIRTVVILAICLGMVIYRKEWVPLDKLPTRTVLFLIASGIATGLSWLCYFRALQLGPASLVAPVDKLSVLVVIALSVLLLGEPLSWKLLLGGACILVGVVLLST